MMRIQLEHALASAWDSATPVAELIKLATHEHPCVRRWVARNPNTPPDILAKLVADNSDVRYELSKNRNTTAETLSVLAEDKTSTVRYWVANHMDTPVEALIKLVEDQDQDVRITAGYHPNLPEVVKAWLKMDGFAGMTLAEFIRATQETP
jgi:Leucine rich repeat variant